MSASNPIRIDLYSDTVTRPTQAMRQFMCQAEVGDEQLGEDPTVNHLIEMVCTLLGKEDAVFLPSGTMCNEISFRIHCRPGDEIIMDRTGHSRHFETGGPAAHSGAMIAPLDGVRGVFSAQQAEAAVRPPSRYAPRTRVLAVEQTSNLGGGSIWPLAAIQEICDVADRYELAKHLDGARLMNAVVASGIAAREYAARFDSVWIDLSKGLGAPMGAVLAGSRAFIAEAWRWKQQFGGAMRQAGIVAAGGVYALTHHVERLAEDHSNAQALVSGLAKIEGITVEPVDTNLIFFDVSGLGLSTSEFNAQLLAHDIRMYVISASRMRAVTHLDISKDDIETVIDTIRGIAGASQS